MKIYSLLSLQSTLPVIPEGPAWAVAIVLVLAGVVLIIKEVGKIRSNKNGHTGEHRAYRDTDVLQNMVTTLALISSRLEQLPTKSDMQETLRTNIRHDLRNELTIHVSEPLDNLRKEIKEKKHGS